MSLATWKRHFAPASVIAIEALTSRHGGHLATTSLLSVLTSIQLASYDDHHLRVCSRCSVCMVVHWERARLAI
jgi:hypothetical protein